MLDISSLNLFFKIFEVFGLQYFSFKNLSTKVESKCSKRFHTCYFIFALTLFTSATIAFVKFTLDISEKRVTAKTGFNFLMKSLMNFGIILTVIVGIIESYVKTNQLKTIYNTTKQVSAMCLSYFDYKVDYGPFKKLWMIKFLTVSVLFVTTYTVFTVNHSGRRLIGHLMALFPTFFFVLLTFKLIFHYDLVNFQLEIMYKMMSKDVFIKLNSTNPIQIRHTFQSRSLGIRKIYNVIYEISEIVNDFLAYTALLIIIVLTVVIINSSYNCVVAMTRNGSTKVSSKFLII